MSTSDRSLPYERFVERELILRDELAIDRTVLANERTLLAYVRTGLALAIGGASMMHFSTEGWYWMLGVACVPTGVAVVLLGIGRCSRVWRQVRVVRRNARTLHDNPAGRHGEVKLL